MLERSHGPLEALFVKQVILSSLFIRNRFKQFNCDVILNIRGFYLTERNLKSSGFKKEDSGFLAKL